MDIKVGRNWGLFAAGIALVIIGFVLLMVPGRADGRLRRVAAPGDHRGPHPLGSAHAREELRSEEATPARRGIGGTTAVPVIP